MFDFLWEKKLGEVRLLKIKNLKEFSEKIFRPYEGERLLELMESIKSCGVINPIIVRDTEAGSEILSGHNRVRASKAVGFITVPAYNLGEISDDEARFVVTESNVVQRGFMELAISERAKCIGIRYEATKKQGLRKDILEDVAMLLNEQDGMIFPIDRQEVVDEFRLGGRSQRRYMRINLLIDGLKEQIDDGRFPLNAGVNFSYLAQKNQEVVCQFLKESPVKVSVKDSVTIRVSDGEGRFSEAALRKVFEKAAVETKGVTGKISVRRNLMDKYFVGYEKNEINETIEDALAYWFEVNANSQNIL